MIAFGIGLVLGLFFIVIHGKGGTNYFQKWNEEDKLQLEKEKKEKEIKYKENPELEKKEKEELSEMKENIRNRTKQIMSKIDPEKREIVENFMKEKVKEIQEKNKNAKQNDEIPAETFKYDYFLIAVVMFLIYQYITYFHGDIWEYIDSYFF